MSATVIGDSIYYSKDLINKLTYREFKIVLAHEFAHWINMDTIKFFIAQIILFPFPKLIAKYKRYLETEADRYAITKTKDPDAYLSLLNKIHRDITYPDINLSKQLAKSAR